MFIPKFQGHVHDFSKPLTKKVMLHSYNPGTETTAYDMLKQRKCSCGAVQTYDLVRKVL